MGVIAECFSDDKGLVWPGAIAPAQVYLINVGDSEAVKKAADELYKRLTESEIAVLYDDRDVRAGQKFADADLTGVPHRIVVSDKTTETKHFELKHRTSDKVSMLDYNGIIKSLTDARS